MKRYEIIYFSDFSSTKGIKFKSIIRLLSLLFILVLTISFTPISIKSAISQPLFQNETKVPGTDVSYLPEPEYPKVSGPNPEWYRMENQP